MSVSLSRRYPLLAHQIQDKDLGELIILSWIWKMLPTVNLTPLPYGEEVLTHKESDLWIRTKKTPYECVTRVSNVSVQRAQKSHRPANPST